MARKANVGVQVPVLAPSKFPSQVTAQLRHILLSHGPDEFEHAKRMLEEVATDAVIPFKQIREQFVTESLQMAARTDEEKREAREMAKTVYQKTLEELEAVRGVYMANLSNAALLPLLGAQIASLTDQLLRVAELLGNFDQLIGAVAVAKQSGKNQTKVAQIEAESRVQAAAASPAAVHDNRMMVLSFPKTPEINELERQRLGLPPMPKLIEANVTVEG